MLHQRQQAEYRRRQALDHARKAQAARELAVFIEKIRDEVWGAAYTELEATFGMLPEALLEAIHRGLTASLKDLDNHWKKAVVTSAKVVPARTFRLLDPKTDIDDMKPLDEALTLQIRNDVVDLIAQYAEDYGKFHRDDLTPWVEALIAKPEMQAKEIISAAGGRTNKRRAHEQTT